MVELAVRSATSKVFPAQDKVARLAIRTTASQSSAAQGLATRPASSMHVQLKNGEEEDDEFEYDRGRLQELPYLTDISDLVTARKIDKDMRETLFTLRATELDLENWHTDLERIESAFSQGSPTEEVAASLRALTRSISNRSMHDALEFEVAKHAEVVRIFRHHHMFLARWLVVPHHQQSKVEITNIYQTEREYHARVRSLGKQTNATTAWHNDELPWDGDQRASTPVVSWQTHHRPGAIQNPLSAQKKQLRMAVDRYENLKGHTEKLLEEHKEMMWLVIAAVEKKGRWDRINSNGEYGANYSYLQACKDILSVVT